MSPYLFSGSGGVAAQLAALAEELFGGELPVRIRAWDGSVVGPADENAPTLVINSRKALRRLLWHPGELGLAQAYVTGELDVEGDLATGFRTIWATARERGLGKVSIAPRDVPRLVKQAVRLGVVGPPPRTPASQASVKGGLHSLLRDRAAIHHHYDMSNAFYELLLDEHMAYSCAYWTSEDPGYTLADAQRDKLDLVCRKLGLHELGDGARLLDVGCGWGSMILYAAETYGVRATGVTLAAEQAAFIRARVAERGLEHLVEVRLQDYREIPDDEPYDAISSIEMGEHVGIENYGVYTATLHRLVKPGRRVLIQQMSRAAGAAPGGGPFIEAYIVPDMHMRPVGRTVDLIEASGLEVRDVHALREHYVRTCAVWIETFEQHYDEIAAMVGAEVARVWRLYLVGGSLAFEENRMGVDQILSVRPDGGMSGMPAVRLG